MKWWKKAYALKNKGLYIDFKNGKWENYESIENGEYNESKAIIENIVLVIHKILKINMDQFVKLFENEIAST